MIKIFFVKKMIEKTCALPELKETENITYFLLLKAHPH